MRSRDTRLLRLEQVDPVKRVSTIFRRKREFSACPGRRGASLVTIKQKLERAFIERSNRECARFSLNLDVEAVPCVDDCRIEGRIAATERDLPPTLARNHPAIASLPRRLRAEFLPLSLFTRHDGRTRGRNLGWGKRI